MIILGVEWLNKVKACLPALTNQHIIRKFTVSGWVKLLVHKRPTYRANDTAPLQRQTSHIHLALLLAGTALLARSTHVRGTHRRRLAPQLLLEAERAEALRKKVPAEEGAVRLGQVPAGHAPVEQGERVDHVHAIGEHAVELQLQAVDDEAEGGVRECVHEAEGLLRHEGLRVVHGGDQATERQCQWRKDLAVDVFELLHGQILRDGDYAWHRLHAHFPVRVFAVFEKFN